MADVSIVRCNSYSESDAAVKRALDILGGIGSFVKPEDKVLLKVNLLLPAKPEAAICTHPKIAESVIEILKSQGTEVWVGDSSGGIGKTESAYEVSGIKEVCEKHRARWINFDTSGVRKIEIPGGKVLKQLHVALALFEADVVINMPKLKTHALTLYTGAIKNLFGTIPGGKKSEIHAMTHSESYRFSEALVDIYSKIPVHLNIMDGIVGMEGIGPNHGRPIKSGLVIAGRNAVELDTVCTAIMGYSPKDIPMLTIASKRGLGTIDPKKISIMGEELEQVKMNFKKPTRVHRSLMVLPDFVRNLFLETPKLPYPNVPGCNGCGDCQINCPVSAIKVEDFPEFDHDKCIRCYCCHELCPQDGIKLKKALRTRN